MRNTAPRRPNPISGRNSYMYMHTSAAPVFPQEEYTYKRPQVKRKRNAPVVKDSYVRVSDEGKRPVVYYLTLPLVMCVLLSIAFLVINTQKSVVNAEIKATQALTQKTENVNERLNILLSENMDMEAIRKIATTRLGMQTAAPHQIVNINVQKDSYSIQYEDKVAENNNKGFFGLAIFGN